MRKTDRYLVEYIDFMHIDQERAEKIKKTKKRKRVEEAIAVAILQDNPKKAIDIAEKHEIPPQEFGKMVAKYSKFQGMAK